jgi:hypothetical protein
VVKAIEEKPVEKVKAEILDAVCTSVSGLASAVREDTVKAWIDSEEMRLRAELVSGAWVNTFQGKYIFKRICGGLLKEDPIRVRHAYIDIALSGKREAVSEVVDLFRGM